MLAQAAVAPARRQAQKRSRGPAGAAPRLNTLWGREFFRPRRSGLGLRLNVSGGWRWRGVSNLHRPRLGRRMPTAPAC